MKNATLPSLRVEPGLRQSAERVLKGGETLSAFIEQAIRDTIRSRGIHREFLARVIAGRDEARASGEYYAADDVLCERADMLAEAQAGHSE